MSDSDGGVYADWKYYQYNPSMPAAVIFIILFLAVSVLHLYQMVRTRVWIFIPFVLGGFCKLIALNGVESILELTRLFCEQFSLLDMLV